MAGEKPSHPAAGGKRAPRAEEVDWQALSPESQDTLRRSSCESRSVRTYAQVAHELGISEPQITKRVKALRGEILNQVG